MYYPLNYFLSRPDARQFFKDMEANRATLNVRRSEQLALARLEPWIRSQGGNERSPSEAMVEVTQELQGMLAWGEWALRGRRIISVQESLCHAFEHSDCAELHIADVLPEDPATLYLHFQGTLESPVDLGDGAHLEGAYVVSHPGAAMRVVLCSRAPGSWPAGAKWRERYDLRIPAEFLHLGADAAIDKALEEDLADLRAARASPRVRDDPVSTQAVDTLLQRMQEGLGAYRSALRLVLNTLAYLKHYNADSRVGWPTQAPERLTAQTLSAAPKERARGLSKLWALGFTPVTFLGEDFADKLRRSNAGGTLRTHWRRGHWRNQLHGPAFSLRKLIWLQPTLVGADRQEAATSKASPSPAVKKKTAQATLGQSSKE